MIRMACGALLTVVLALIAPIDPATIGVGWWTIEAESVRIATAIIALALVASLWPSIPRPSLGQPAWWFLSLPILGILGTPFADSPALALRSSVLAFLVGLAVVSAVRCFGREHSALLLLLALGAQLVISVPVERFGLPTPLELFHAQDLGVSRLGRYRGVFSNPNEMGQAALIALALLVAARRRLRPEWIALTGLVAAGSLIASQSRTSVLALVVAACAVGFFASSGRVRQVVGSFAALGAIGLVGLLASGSLTRIFGSRDNGAPLTSFSGRTSIWQAAVDATSADPVSGVGFGNVDLAMLEARRLGTIDNPVEHAHNTALQVAVMLGLVGLLLFVVGVAVAARRVGDIDAFDVRFIAVALVVLGLTESLFRTVPVWFDIGLWWLCGAVSIQSKPTLRPKVRAVIDPKTVMKEGAHAATA